MAKPLSIGRVLGVVVLVAGLILGGGALSQQTDHSAEMPWQAVIDAQLEAFRNGEADAAFGFAARGFHEHYSDSSAFVTDIRQGGYAPLLDSRAHSFGRFQIEGDLVRQIVTLQGPDQIVYQAFYTLEQEEAGWRVLGVVLHKQNAVGV